MRWLLLGLAVVGIAGCGRAPQEMGDAAAEATGLSFTYRYGFRLPSDRIADAQDAHARACERLGAARCRITGMTYRVDDAGTASASLDVRLAAPIARGFGRQGVQAIEATGGALIEAEIGGTDTAAPAAGDARAGTLAAADRDRLERELARPDLPAAERAELRAQLAAATAGTRAADAATAAARLSVDFTPMSFAYRAGRGVGVGAQVADAWGLLAASAATTLGFTLTALAVLGPPALLFFALFLIWHHLGRRLWRRMMGSPAVG